MEKSTVSEIRKRFDQDVERFANLQTGQISTLDAEISLELITESARRIVPDARDILDIGCGAGNYSLKMLSKIPNLNCTLIDLSKPMLDKALERISGATIGGIDTIQGDIREVMLEANKYDIILAGAVLHHLREASEWKSVFRKLYLSLKKGGCLMISDLVTQDSPELTALMWEKYGGYLEKIGGHEYREKVLAYVEKEDSPRSVSFQLESMKEAGFSKTEILHKNICFAAFAGIK